MKIQYKDYKDKILGCLYGKNIGGTLGAPFECYRGVYDVTIYTQDTSKPIPNDDVDLQLVWLRAVELEKGRLDSHVLAEYWSTYISASLSEYGTGKNNFRMGIRPPLSGHLRNRNRDSNGAWIRTEIWACLAAGHPDVAVRYALEDAMVDHSGEGVYSAIFLAAMQSAAFVESDPYKLISIGLSYIPEDCGITKGVHTVMECKEKGMDWKQARKALFQAVPGSFGMMGGYYKGQIPEEDVPVGENGYDAPSNVGIIIIGLLYGEGDFGRSICLATNCGEDTDCTAGSLGALLGIISGKSNLPEKWVKGCSDEISTWCLRIDAALRLMLLFNSYIIWEWRSKKIVNWICLRRSISMQMINEFPRRLPIWKRNWEPEIRSRKFFPNLLSMNLPCRIGLSRIREVKSLWQLQANAGPLSRHNLDLCPVT